MSLKTSGMSRPLPPTQTNNVDEGNEKAKNTSRDRDCATSLFLWKAFASIGRMSVLLSCHMSSRFSLNASSCICKVDFESKRSLLGDEVLLSWKATLGDYQWC
jgi:hypothetical protein